MAFNATDLRKDIYKILDRILETGEEIEIVRKGKRLRIVPITEAPRLERLAPLEGLIVGDPDDFEHLDWSETWHP